MRRLFAVVCVLATMVLAVPATASAAPTERPLDLTCDLDGTTSGHFQLRHDLTCPFLSLGARSAPATVVVDLGGHTLTAAVDVFDALSLSIRNGTLAGSLKYWGSDQSLSESISHVHVTGFVSVVMLASESIRNSVVDGNVGIEGGPTVIDHSTVGSLGFDDGSFGVAFTLTHSVVHGGIGVVGGFLGFGAVDGFAKIAHNTIIGSPGPGISLDVSHWNATISDNTITGAAGDGIALGATDPLGGHITLHNNHVVGNGGHGIEVLSVLPPNVVTDAGGNQASANALDPQCVGIVCQT